MSRTSNILYTDEVVVFKNQVLDTLVKILFSVILTKNLL